MIRLRDSIEIRTGASDIFEWFEDLPKHYRAWHPDHVVCRFDRGDAIRPGARLYAEEYLHGRLHRLRFSITDVALPWRVEYRIAPGLRGAFAAEETQDGTLFTAEIDLGFELPVLGGLIDRAFTTLFASRIRAIEEHMREEGENLKLIMESE
jgi:hypothetical protein